MRHWVFAPLNDFGLRNDRFHARSAFEFSWASMIKPSPKLSSQCSIRPFSPSTLSLTSKPKASHSQSIAAAASLYTTALEKRGQPLGVGFMSPSMFDTDEGRLLTR